MSSVAFNPMVTSNAGSGSFLLKTDGIVQGTSWDNPAAYMFLESGKYSNASSTIPILGGFPVLASIGSEDSPNVGPTLTLATSGSPAFNGWSTFDRQFSGIQIPGQVPYTWPGMTANFYRTGVGGVRLALQCSAALASALGTESESVAIYWNFTTNMLDTSGTQLTGARVVSEVFSNAMVCTYDSGTSTYSWQTGTAVMVLI